MVNLRVPVGISIAVTFLQQRVRAANVCDRLHKLTNFWKMAFDNCELASCASKARGCLERSLWSLEQGGFHQQLRQTCVDDFKHLRADNLLYEHLYSDMCHDIAATETSEACGNEAHQAALFWKLEGWMSSAVKHVEAKQSRWFPWEHRASLA